MAKSKQDGDVRDRRPIESLQPHVVVAFWEEIDLTYEPGAERELVERGLAPWEELENDFPDMRLVPLFTALDEGGIGELQAKAAQMDPSYEQPRLTRYFRVDAPTEIDLDAVAEVMSRWQNVETAYVDRPGPDPAVAAVDDPRSANQVYLDPAPDGIDAEYAWGFPGGDGAGQRLVDLERGWTFDHEDITAHGVSLLHGSIRDGSRSHGTSVLGEVCASDNTVGCIGIAPAIDSVDATSYWESNRPDAMLAAIKTLDFGEVLLLEAQVTVPNGTAGLLGPIEVLDADFEIIRLATALGIIVVEAGGNGTNNGMAPPLAMDTYQTAAGARILWRDPSNPDFRDSGAIIVTAATSAAPHTRLAYGPHGARIDCYAWSENVDTLRSNSAGATDLYRTDFSGTSSASPIVAGAALLVQGISEQTLGFRLSPAQMRDLLSDPTINTPPDATEVTAMGVMPDLRGIIDDVLGIAPDVYIRDNVGDNGDPHTGSISASPDIITAPTPTANPQVAYGPGSGTENSVWSSSIEAGQDNFIYTRTLNRGGSDAADVRATVFWSEVSTLVTPDLWNLIGDVVIPNVPSGDVLTVSDAITWTAADIPGPGHYCFVGLVGNADDPAPTPTDFLDWNTFRQFILQNNNVTWRNFNVVDNEPDDPAEPVALEFISPGAPDKARLMTIEVCARLPRGSQVGLRMDEALAEQLCRHDNQRRPKLPPVIDLTERLRIRGLRRLPRPINVTPLDLGGLIQRGPWKRPDKGQLIVPVNPHGCHRFAETLFPARTVNRLALLVNIPKKYRNQSFEVFVRQLFEGDEVGRVTWRLSPRRG